MQKESTVKEGENAEQLKGPINLDISRTIRKVSVCVQDGVNNAKAREIFAAKLLDDNDQEVAFLN